jgi:hypothetical protein
MHSFSTTRNPKVAYQITKEDQMDIESCCAVGLVIIWVIIVLIQDDKHKRW